MGLAFSRIKPEDWNPKHPGERPRNVETLADYDIPIETRDILHRKLSRYTARFCLSSEEELGFESLFFTHISKPVGSTDAYWSEKDLLKFCSTVPDPSFPKLPLSCSMLYRLLLRLGSFPYITNPAPHLTYDVFRLGLVMLSGKYIAYGDDIPHGNEKVRFISREYQRMLFQALVQTSCKARSSISTKDRSDSDDKDVRSALKFLENAQQWDGPNPCIGFLPAPLPTPSSLPSSLSTNLHGTISSVEMKDLLETLLILKLRVIGIRIDYTSSSTPDLRQVVESIISAIDNSTLGEIGKDIDWPTFSNLFDTFIPKALEGLPRILDFFSIPPSSRGESSTVQNRSKYPQSLDQFIPSFQGKTMDLFTLPIFSQIFCCIDFQNSIYRLQTPSFIFSGNLAGLLAAAPKIENIQGPKEFILLLSGISSENEGDCPPKEALYAIVCLDNCQDPYQVANYNNNEPFGVLVQLAPTLRRFSPSPPLSPNTPTLLTRMEFRKDTQNLFEIQIKNSSNGWAQLSLQQDIFTYIRASWAWEEQERGEESLKVEKIELIIF
ncbi:hypothetical protein BT63DRAFT_1172 [Microthyrium microscopicum]|uniref:TLDc domain-containing protein n=1 Tax=Microthyrium microscopicum TaxID=703497 RepID=A0A6A6UP35_9PEZI|nr:hypothetical protein BT63DRAFT_1172 [Microthyrium microscopicum]